VGCGTWYAPRSAERTCRSAHTRIRLTSLVLVGLPNTPMKPHLARIRSAEPHRTGISVTTLAIVGTLLSVAAALAACSSSSPSVSGPRATYHADNARTGYSTDTAITTANATRLTQQWSVKQTAAISVQAIVTDGVVYWGDWNGIEHATTTAGKQLWSVSIGIAPKPKACPFKLGPIGVVSSGTVGDIGTKKALWVGGGNGSLYALDASTGAVIWKTQLGEPPLHVLWSSPAFYNGSIYEGVASWNDCPDVNGSFVRVDAATGAIQATFTPSVPNKCVGGGIWSSAAADPITNAIYVGTGPTYLRADPSKACATPDQEAVVRLNPTTLDLQSRWQLPADQAGFDLDFGATPMLFTTAVNGVSRELVGAENKNGFYYVFDRNDLTAGPVWSYQAETNAALNSSACESRNTISTSAWAGQGSPVIVAGIAVNGQSCIGTITALDAATGRPLWQVPVGGVVQGAVTEVPGLVAVGAGPFLQVLSSSSGTSLFTYHEPAGLDSGNGQGQNYFFWPPPTISGT
jgi:polyvinyl alcohol dehydrogenase (cytochrome)